MEKYVLKNITRPDKTIVERFAELDVSTVYEAQGKQGLMSSRLRPVYQGNRIFGPAVTVICPTGDNLMIHAAIEVVKPGDVLVVATVGDGIYGMVGELIVSALMKRGVQGMVIDSGIRDAAQIREMGFPVWSQALISQGTTKSRGGWVNAPAVCGGCLVAPGDLIMADDDGVVVVAQADLEFTLKESKKRMAKEEETKRKIAEGQLSVDFYSLREVLNKENVKYYEHASDIGK